jgi:hypothetical protein
MFILSLNSRLINIEKYTESTNIKVVFSQEYIINVVLTLGTLSTLRYKTVLL